MDGIFFSLCFVICDLALFSFDIRKNMGLPSGDGEPKTMDGIFCSLCFEICDLAIFSFDIGIGIITLSVLVMESQKPWMASLLTEQPIFCLP